MDSCYNSLMLATQTFESTRFPIVYDGDRATAVLVDIDTYRKIELILTNLVERKMEEPEDNLIRAASDLWTKTILQSKQEASTQNWMQALDEL